MFASGHRPRTSHILIGMSDYMRKLRAKVGHDLLFVSASGTYVFDADRRVLLIRHSEGGRWTNPGGMIEPFETPADAAVRETWEETGLVVRLTRFIGVFGGRDHHIRYSSGDEVAYVAFAFEATVVGGNLAPDRAETIEARYVTLAEAFTLDLTPQTQRALTVVFGVGHGTYFDEPTWVPPTA